jgi:hypothetical protein
MCNTLRQLLFAAPLLFFFQSNPALSQVPLNYYSPDTRLYECMDKAYVDQLSADRSDLILYYNYYLDHSYYVASIKAEKPVTGTDIHTVTVNSDKKSPDKQLFNEKQYMQGKFNPLKYNFSPALDGFTTYIWKEAGIALVFYPLRYFQSQYNEYIKEQNIK